jgi:hypothetical protein
VVDRGGEEGAGDALPALLSADDEADYRPDRAIVERSEGLPVS